MQNPAFLRAMWRREPISFEVALFTVSDYLTEAIALEERGALREASTVYARAEQYAMQVGYLELMRLVWQYEGMGCPPSSDCCA